VRAWLKRERIFPSRAWLLARVGKQQPARHLVSGAPQKAGARPLRLHGSWRSRTMAA
jgi:hypothetical protein